MMSMGKTRTPSSSTAVSASELAEAGLEGLRYEDALAELEQLVERMETGALPLDDVLTQYRRGAQLLNFCRARLVQVEEQVKVLEAGELKPWRGGA
jgi:exodeoxyribonuclease VII small subunit